MTPHTRNEFIEYCLRRLGKPVIEVNVSEAQIEDRVDEALYRFYERHYQAVEEVFILYDITSPELIIDSNGDAVLDSNGEPTYTTNNITDGYITLDESIIAVTDVLQPNQSFLHSPTSDVDFNAFYNLANVNVTGLNYFYMSQMHVTLLNRFFNPIKTFNFNAVTNKLIIAGGLKSTENKWGGIIIRCLRRIYGETPSHNSTIPSYNIWKINWLQKYCTALIKQQWGQNLSKYQQVQLLGGVTMNGEQIHQQAEEEIQKLEEQLQLEYEEPPRFSWG